tara:strand:+ start:1262 stop:1516 length:255 start_codon:yes stop_codon:yes gene_type:complete
MIDKGTFLEYVEYMIEQLIMEDYLQIDYEYWDLYELAKEVTNELYGLADYNDVVRRFDEGEGGNYVNELNIAIEEVAEEINRLG